MLFSVLLPLFKVNVVSADDCGTRTESPCTRVYCDTICRKWCDSQGKPDCIATYGTNTTLWDNCCYDGMESGACARIGVDEKKECDCDNVTADGSTTKVEYPYFQCFGTTQASPPLIPPYVYCGAGLNGELCCDTQEACLKRVPATPTPAQVPGATDSIYKICDQIPEHLSNQKQDCLDCVGNEDGYGGVWTAIGCIPNDPETIVSVFLRFGIGMGGGVALLMILGAGFMLTVSQGDPKQTDTAKQWLSSAIAGLLFIIFSVTILQFIGYNVFQIPGFGG